MIRRKIGIPFWKVGDMFGSTLPYLEFLSQFGEIIPLMPEHTIREDLDLLFLPGGADIDPQAYGEVPSFYTNKSDIYKEHFDKNYLPLYTEIGTPIFGACRGHQAYAAFKGAKLIQHMFHETNPPEDGMRSMHYLRFTMDIPNISIQKDTIIPVNSRHHQVVDLDSLKNTSLVSAGVYHQDTEKGFQFEETNEILIDIKYPAVTVQFHPEDHYTDFVENTILYLMEERKPIL